MTLEDSVRRIVETSIPDEERLEEVGLLKDENPEELELWHLPEELQGVGGAGGGQGRRGRVPGQQQVQGNLQEIKCSRD